VKATVAETWQKKGRKNKGEEGEKKTGDKLVF
jgi:hypothetical protein